jgi:hypothetical protein
VKVSRRAHGGVGEQVRRRHEWLELLQTSGPFLTLPVVDRAMPSFPNGVAQASAQQRARLRAEVADMLNDRGATRHAVVTTMLGDILAWGDHLRIDTEIPETLAEPVPEHGLLIRPDFGFHAVDDEDNGGDADTDEIDDDDDADAEEDDAAEGAAKPDAAAHGSGPWRLLGTYLPYGTHPLARTSTGSWTASAVERLAILLRARDVPIGITTDGRWWALVWAPRKGATGAAVWDASLFGEEAASFHAFVALLHSSRFMAEQPKNKLPALFAESLERQEEVTETLGRQVREAVELLVTTLDRLDQESGNELLANVSDDDLYAGVVTFMMRVVFLLFAEERRLLPSDDDLYVTAYSVSNLVEQLEQQDSLGAVLGQRTSAWHRLLAATRAVHSGVAHEDLRLPAYGGNLFDPDRYPWLEGRPDKDTPAAAARPPAVDDRTVLRMLRAVQYVQIGGERRRLTFRALDVEQIGYVYEGLLELEVRSAAEPVLGLARPAKWPQKIKADAEIPLSTARDLGEKEIGEITGWAAKKVRAALASPDADEERSRALRHAVSDSQLLADVLPFAALLRFEEFESGGRKDLGNPAVFAAGTRYVTNSHRRAATGTHYTPRQLAEEVAEGALQPLVYRPGPLETSDQSQWKIRPSSEIKKLKVADIAMGSGAFLVAACRYLADRLIEAWLAEGDAEAVALDLHRTSGRVGTDAEADQLLLKARRDITEHCLYGVDINPLAVEMAKLSLWLITMDTERPFGFLDDRLEAGDSLLGLVSVEQLEALHVDAADGRRLHHGTLDFAEPWRQRLAEAADLRRRIIDAPSLTIRDIEHKARLNAEAEKLSGGLKAVADAITATGLAAAKLRGRRLDEAFLNLLVLITIAVEDGPEQLAPYVKKNLQDPRPEETVEREPFHWTLAFPEVFADTTTPGFDAIIGNPPFLGGSKISGTMGDDYLACLQRWDGNDVKGNTDLGARFVLRADRLLSRRGQLGYVTTNSLIEGATLRVGLEQVSLTIRAGRSPHPWPTKSANLQIIEVWASRAPLSRRAVRWLDGEEVPAIGPDLEPYGRIRGRPKRLEENKDVAFNGSKVLGQGFILSAEEKNDLIYHRQQNADVIQEYVTGRDLNQRPDSTASRWIINFRDWPLQHAEEYPDCIDIVRRLVRPERARNNRQQRRERWWIYAERAPDLYDAIESLNQVFAISIVSNSIMPVVVPMRQVFSHACAAFALSKFADLAILSSSIHSTWVIRYTSTMRTDIRYAPSDVFLSLARPEPTSELESLGRELDETRRSVMLSRAWGLTKTYNKVHSPDNHEPPIRELRDIHVAIDEAVMRAYGWDDLDLKIGHHPTKIGIRWTVSKEARFELLDRLLEENHRRYALENPS